MTIDEDQIKDWLVNDPSHQEQWSELVEFPNYLISDLGRIYNRRRDQYMRTSLTRENHVKITLADEHGVRHTRSVSRLVAEAFIEPPTTACDQVVILDGDYTNVRAQNLVWRPRWFAWKYSVQLKEYQPKHYKTLHVRNITEGIEYGCIIDAGIAEGLLFSEIWRSTYSGDAIFPHWSVFEIFR